MTIKKKFVYCVSFAFVWSIIYFVIQSRVSIGVYDFLLPFDQSVPLMPQFIWIYHSLAPISFFTMIYFVKDKNLFFTTLTAAAAASLVLQFCYITFPSFYPREPFVVDGLSDAFLFYTRLVDGANNTFPSGHVTFSLLVFLAAINSTFVNKVEGLGRLYLLWFIGICFSTMALKQHYLVDVLSGIVLALSCFYFSKWLITKRNRIYRQGG